MNLLPPTLACFMGGLLFAHGIPEPTSIELPVDHSEKPLRRPSLTVPYDTTTLRFFVKPQLLRVRYKLEGLDSGWQQRTEEMFLIVRFLNKKGDQISQEAFPAKGVSGGWKGSVERSEFTARREIV